VRHPNGFAYSQWQVKSNAKGIPWSKKIPLWQSAFTWLKKNLIVELFFKKSKYLRVHYEDFIKYPTQVIKRTEEILDCRLDDQLSFIDGNKMKLGEQHLTRGNLDAVGKGKEEIVLKLDERWKRNMKWWNIVLVTLITWPLLLKYFLFDKIKR
jgi:hypothetical protein